MDYDLTRLGSDEFEHLVQALCVAALGAQVSTFGDGPDGGREATLEGHVEWSTEPGAGAAAWNGYTVVQAKFRKRPEGVESNLKWLRSELSKELTRWTDSRYKRSKTRKPDNLLIVTNVRLSAATAGGVDTANKEIAASITDHKIDIKAWRLWHYDDLRALLDSYKDVRISYGGFLTTGDVLAHLDEWLGNKYHDLQEALTVHAIKEMLAQQYVRLGQAGDPSDERLALGSVVVDIPAIRPPRLDIFVEGISDLANFGSTEFVDDYRRLSDNLTSETNALQVVGASGKGKTMLVFDSLAAGHFRRTSEIPAAAYILSRGEHVRDHGLTPGQPPHLLVVGGPGQGKSTLAQLICQAYRISLLQNSKSLSPQAVRLRDSLIENLAKIGLGLPKHLRWPIRVNLSEYGDALAANPELSLLRYLAERVNTLSPYDINAGDLMSWLGRWPWLLVLDGLDEVAAPHIREQVTEGVNAFLVDATTASADVLIVATTRPQGYAGEFGAQDYERLNLIPLDADGAMSYASRLVAARFSENDELRRQVLMRIREATADPDSSRLLTTPLQVTIMALLLERRQRVPHDRYQLFDAYFDTIYSREANKLTSLGRLLEEYRADIEAIHETVALALQQQAETENDPSIPATELRTHALDRLRAEGHGEDQATKLATQLVDAATKRLVLLVPHKIDEIAFEVRSLQEYMTARALTNDEGPTILERLRLLIPSAHWRNTWLFAAGRIFREREKLRADLISLLAQVDNEDFLPWLARSGAELATDLLADDLAVKSPQYRRLLADLAIGRLDGLPDNTWRNLGTLLQRIAEEDPLVRQKIDHQVKISLNAGGGTKAHMILMLDVWQGSTGGFAAKARQLYQQYNELNSLETFGTLFIRELATTHNPKMPHPKRARKLPGYLTRYTPKLEGEDAAALNRLIKALKGYWVGEFRSVEAEHKEDAAIITRSQIPPIAVLDDALNRPSVADAFSELVDQIKTSDWHVAYTLREIVRYWYARRALPPSM